MLGWGHSWYNQEKLMGFFEKIHGWNLPQTNSGMNGVVIWTGWLASEELGRRTCKNQMCDLHRVTLIHLYIYNIYPYIYIHIIRIDWVPINECDDLLTMTNFCRASLIKRDCHPWIVPLEMTCPAPSVDEHYQFKICHQYATNGLPQNSWTADCFP